MLNFRSHSFDLSEFRRELNSRLEEIAVVRTLPDDAEYHDFFWNHAEVVAKEHELELHQIVVCELNIVDLVELLP